MNKQLDAERGESQKMLIDWLKDKPQIFTILRHVSRSGMSRQISFLIFMDNKPLFLDYHIGKLMEYRSGKHDGLIVGGCGMDMGYHVVHTISRILFNDGYYLSENRWL